MKALLQRLVGIVLCAPCLQANTWIVDVNNGPGTHFTSLNAAIAAVSPNDTLLILPGTYTAAICNKPLRMVGVGTSSLNPVWVSSLLLFDLPTNSTTAIANMRFFGASTCLTTQNCQGSVLVEGATCSRVTVTNCADVRFRALVTQNFCAVTNSRVEIADSTLVGGTGSSCICCDYPQTGGSGAPGMFANGGEIHVIRTTVRGGGGGGSTCADTGLCGADGGNGGSGIALTNSARLIVSGPPENTIQGGAGGVPAWFCTGFDGAPGPALNIQAGCEARISGQSIVGSIVNLGSLIQPTVPDPYFRAVGDAVAGSNWTLRVSGEPGSSVQVVLGRRPTLIGPTPALDEEPMCPVHRVFQLGTIPSTGTVSMNFPIPPTWDQGFSVVFQALITPVSGGTSYTNSLPAVLR